MNSKFVTEDVIESIIEKIEGENTLTDLVSRWEKDFIALDNYMHQESFSLLTTEEKVYLEMMVAVIFLSWEEVNGRFTQDLDAKLLEKIEELNWEKFHSSRAKGFRDKLNPFFDNHSQEDLLAFIEDSIEDDEDQMVTGAARDIVFICTVTVLDTIIAQAEK